jgi:hypothetical protein
VKTSNQTLYKIYFNNVIRLGCLGHKSDDRIAEFTNNLKTLKKYTETIR